MSAAAGPADLAAYLAERRRQVDQALDRCLPPRAAPPGTIHSAMRHSLFAGGKRIRPILAIAAAEACGRPGAALGAACALECVHTYSLIHDDLPALDDDDLRRGQPTCHKAFGEAVAVLAGDALLTLAFGILAGLDLPAGTGVRLVAELAAAAGTRDGMIGGQVADLEAERGVTGPDELDYIHRAKTAALIRASVRCGALCAGADARRLDALGAFGDSIGLAFQIVDDILDVVATSAELGKTAGKDQRQSKATFPAVHGIDASRARARECLGDALAALEAFGGRAGALPALAELIVSRTR